MRAVLALLAIGFFLLRCRELSGGQALQQTLRARLSAASGVNMDTEMSHMIQLQNAYSANARIISTVQSLFADLLQIIR